MNLCNFTAFTAHLTKFSAFTALSYIILRWMAVTPRPGKSLARTSHHCNFTLNRWMHQGETEKATGVTSEGLGSGPSPSQWLCLLETRQPMKVTRKKGPVNRAKSLEERGQRRPLLNGQRSVFILELNISDADVPGTSDFWWDHFGSHTEVLCNPKYMVAKVLQSHKCLASGLIRGHFCLEPQSGLILTQMRSDCNSE